MALRIVDFARREEHMALFAYLCSARKVPTGAPGPPLHVPLLTLWGHYAAGSRNKTDRTEAVERTVRPAEDFIR